MSNPNVVVKTDSSGYQILYLEEGETICKKCKGKGRWDSCFDCGNRGYMLPKEKS